MVYVVVREDEVADQKRTDIRLLSTLSTDKAAIEVKIADSWAMADFKIALSNQLVGQYLRHATSKAGCLLLVYCGRKQYWIRQDTGERASFSEILAELAADAKELEKKSLFDLRLSVVGLDLRKPSLRPARR